MKLRKTRGVTVKKTVKNMINTICKVKGKNKRYSNPAATIAVARSIIFVMSDSVLYEVYIPNKPNIHTIVIGKVIREIIGNTF